MFRRKLAILCLVALSVLAVNGVASAGIINPCVSTWWVEGTPNAVTGAYPLFICPLGDTDSFEDQGWMIVVLVLDITGTGIANVPPTDFYIVECGTPTTYPWNDCNLGSASSNADSLTNSSGQTTMSNTGLVGGGCAQGWAVVVQNYTIEDSLTNCQTPLCDTDIWMSSPDQNGDGIVELADLSIFATRYPPNGYHICADYDANNVVDLSDLSRFAFHYVPGSEHQCI